MASSRARSSSSCALISAWLATALLMCSIWLGELGVLARLLGELFALHLVEQEEADDLDDDHAEHDEQPALVWPRGAALGARASAAGG